MRKPTTFALLWLLRFVVLVSATLLCLCLTVQAQRTTHIPADAPTIQSAIDASTNGDILLVAPGTYFENLDLHGRSITIKSTEGPVVTVIDGRRLAPVVTFATHETRATILSGFTLRNGAPASDTVHGGGILLVGSAPTLTENILAENLCAAVDATNSALLLTHTTITHTEPGPGCIAQMVAPVVLSESTGSILRNNLIEHNDHAVLAGAIAVLGGHATLDGNVIRFNTTTNDAPSALAIEGSALITENLIYANTTRCGSAVSIHQGTLLNNTIADNLSDQACPQESPAAELTVFGQVLLANNILSSAQHSALSCTEALALQYNLLDGPASTSCAVDSLTSSPLFVDRTHADYHLSHQSPALDAGTSAIDSLPRHDLDDTPRTHAGRIDLGAYEHAVPHDLAASTTLLNATPNPAEAFQPIALSVQVTAPNTTPTGSITFAANAQPLATVLLDATGHATFTTTILPAGTTILTATYAGSGAPSTSTQIIRIAPATTLLSFAITPSSADNTQTVTLSASAVAPLSTQIPSGQVQFLQIQPTSTPTLLATVTLDAKGLATTTLPSMPSGTWLIDAAFLATPNFASVTLPSTDALTLSIAPRGYSLTTASPTVTLQSGHHASVALNLKSLGTFAAAVTLSCANLPANATCTFSPVSLALTASATIPVTLTLDTDAVPGFLSLLRPANAPTLAFVPLVLLCFVRPRRRVAGILTGLCLMASVTGCSSKYPAQVPSGIYSIQVVSQSAGSSSTQSLPITLLVTN